MDKLSQKRSGVRHINIVRGLFDVMYDELPYPKTKLKK